MKSFIACALLIAGVGIAGTFAAVAKPTCGGSTSSKDINLLKPAIPPRECNYQIKAYSKLVCQLRIDFAMTLAQPTIRQEGGLSYAECTQDYFEVNGIRLCGVELWQHIYVPFNASDGESQFDLTIALANRAGTFGLPTPEWDMTITQLECPAGAAIRELDFDLQPMARATIKDGFLVAPPGCLQYFPQTKGVVKSFNYNDGAGIYPSKMNYAICFRRTVDTTALDLRVYTFHIGSEFSASTLMTDQGCSSSSSYLMVPQATLIETNQRATYFCGDTQKDVVISSNNPGPLMVVVNNDGVYRQAVEGFAFTYTVT